jgi:hypothetical protein
MTAGAAPALLPKTVHLIPKDNAIKRLCFDEATMSLRPNLVLVDRRGSVVFEINELGLKGAARDASRPLVVVWGDSVVFGVRWGWPCLIDEFAPGYQFLNGGIEADPYDNILRRAAAFNQAHAVALNIVMPGWHPVNLTSPLAGRGGPGTLLQWVRKALPALRQPSPAIPPPEPRTTAPETTNQGLRASLLAFLEKTPNTVLVTMPTALNRNIAGEDLSPYFTRGNRETVFYFIGDIPYSLDVQRHLFEHITERNAIMREVAQATGVRLLDLHAGFDTEEAADFRKDFFDVLHLRPGSYRNTARAVYEGIKDLL